MRYRLVRQAREITDSACIRLGEQSWYILQTQEAEGMPWRTCPVVLYDDLSPGEQNEIMQALNT